MSKDKKGKQEKDNYGSDWGEVFQNLQPKLIPFALKCTNGDFAAAEDLLQDTLVRVLKYSPDLSAIRKPLYYLGRTLKNVWIDRWRGKKDLKMESLDSTDGESIVREQAVVQPSILRDLENEDLRNAVRNAMRGIPAVEEKVFKLFLKGYNCIEIGEKIGKDEHYSAYILNKVRSKIRYRLRAFGKKDKKKL